MAAVSKQEYLKRYLSNSDAGKKKKKKKVPKAASKRPASFIVDDDITLKDVAGSNAAQEKNEWEDDVDEAPAVYEVDGVTNISIETFRKREEDKKNKWAPISRNQPSFLGKNEHQIVNDDSDNSPPRAINRSRQDTPDLSPRRDGLLDRHNQSQARKKRDRNSPSRHQSLRESLDQSPVRKSQVGRSVRDFSSTGSGKRELSVQADNSPPRFRRRHDSSDSNDLSPPRQRHSHSSGTSTGARVRHDSPDLSTRHSHTQRDSNDSPLQKTSHSNSGQGHARKQTNSDSDQSPPRKRSSSDSDQSPSRNRSNSDSDQSPPRKHNQSGMRSSKKLGSETRMSTGRKAGLLTASDLKSENKRKRAEEVEMYSKMDPSISGKGSETVYRDKMGRIKDIKMDKVKSREQERKEIEDDKKFMEWGRGVVQTKETREKVEDYLHEVDKPLARYRDDEDLEKMLKDQEREDDPMLAYMKQKKKKQNVKEGKKEKPLYRGPDPPPNRFNIRPGYRWDGVDRSNGFEMKRFAMLANKAASQTQAYKWSSEDM